MNTRLKAKALKRIWWELNELRLERRRKARNASATDPDKWWDWGAAAAYCTAQDLIMAELTRIQAGPP